MGRKLKKSSTFNSEKKLPETELKDRFLVSGVNEWELKVILQQGDASGENNIFKYCGDSLTVEYTNKGKIKSIKGNPEKALVKKALRDVQDAIIRDHGKKIGRCIVFSQVPVKSWYRFKDLLQFYPLENPSPYGPIIGHGDYPFVLEYSYSASSNWILDQKRRLKRQRELVRLLNLIFNWGATEVFADGVCSWVRVPQSWKEHDGEQYADGIPRFHPSLKRESMHLDLGYAYPENFVIIQDEFSNLDSSIEEIKRVLSGKYYNRLGVSGQEVLDLPDTVDAYLTSYINIGAKGIFLIGRYIGFCRLLQCGICPTHCLISA